MTSGEASSVPSTYDYTALVDLLTSYAVLIVGNDIIFDRRRKRTADRLLCNDGPDARGPVRIRLPHLHRAGVRGDSSARGRGWSGVIVLRAVKLVP